MYSSHLKDVRHSAQNVDLSFNPVCLNNSFWKYLIAHCSRILTVNGVDLKTLRQQNKIDVSCDITNSYMTLPFAFEKTRSHLTLSALNTHKDLTYPSSYTIFKLNLDNCKLTSLELLQGKSLGHVRYASLRNNLLEDIRPLALLENVEYLALSGNRIKSLSPISNFKNIKYLDASKNYLSKLKCDKEVESLIYLSLDENNLESIDGAEKFLKLKELCIIHLRIYP
jgi:Leucine-rich repeat (LRR) protein